MAQITKEQFILAVKDPRLIWYYCIGWGLFGIHRMVSSTGYINRQFKKKIDKKREQCVKDFGIDCYLEGNQCSQCNCEFIPLALSGKPCKKKL